MISKEPLPNGWTIVDLSNRPGYSDRKCKILGVEDTTGRLLCSYSSRTLIAKFLAKHGIELEHQHRYRKNGTTTAGNQQWRCSCGATKTDGEDGRGRPRKYAKSSDRYLQVNRKKSKEADLG
jgi:hypothetical protein